MSDIEYAKKRVLDKFKEASRQLAPLIEELYEIKKEIRYADYNEVDKLWLKEQELKKKIDTIAERLAKELTDFTEEMLGKYIETWDVGNAPVLAEYINGSKYGFTSMVPGSLSPKDELPYAIRTLADKLGYEYGEPEYEALAWIGNYMDNDTMMPYIALLLEDGERVLILDEDNRDFNVIIVDPDQNDVEHVSKIYDEIEWARDRLWELSVEKGITDKELEEYYNMIQDCYYGTNDDLEECYEIAKDVKELLKNKHIKI